MHLLSLCLSAGLSIAFSAIAHGQPFPAKAIRLIVPYPPGAAADLIARSAGQKMSESVGQPVVIDNRAGASGNIGSELVARAPADGYTIQIGNDATHGTNMFLTRNFPYDPIKDFTPLTQAVDNIIALALHPSVPPNNVRELIEHARGTRVAYGSSGNGSPHHLAGELMKLMTGAQFEHVPYKGGGPALADLLGNQIPMMFASVATVTPHLANGKVKILAVTGARRFGGLANVPTIGETLSGFEMSSWLGFFGPAGLPAPVTQRLNTELVRALQSAEVRTRLEAAGLIVVAGSPEQFAAVVRAEVERRGKLVKDAGVRVE